MQGKHLQRTAKAPRRAGSRQGSRAPAGPRVWLGLALLLGASCSASRPAVAPADGHVDERSARSASGAGQWELAASRWNTLFMNGEGDPVESCAETVRALMQLEEWESAKGIVDLGLRRTPGAAELLELQGNVLAHMGFRRAAEGSYQKALESEPERASTLLALAEVRLDLGMAAGARDALETRMQNGRSCALTWYLYGRTLAALGREREAVDAYERAFQAGAPATADSLLLAAGTCLERAARKDSVARQLARRWLTTCVELQPQCTLAHHYLGLLAEEEGDLDLALAHHRRAVESDPMHLPSLERLADLYERRGDHELAAEMARRALDLEKNPGRRQSLGALIEETR